MKIVSLLGSATEIMYRLGLGDSLVGISHECDFPPQALDRPRLSRPRFDSEGMTSGEVDAAVRQCMADFGSVYEVDVEGLSRLKPDVVLTQAVCEVCAVPTGSVEAAVESLPSHVDVVSLDAHDIEGILASVDQVAVAAGRPERGRELRQALEDQLASVASRVDGLPRPRVAMLEWLDPPFAPGHWVPEMVKLAGGENLLGDGGRRSEQIEWSRVEGLAPEVLLVEPCGFDLAQAAEDADRHRDRLHRFASTAILDGRAWVLHSAWFSRSGPRVVRGVEVLAEIFHPRSAPPDAIREIARRWR